MKTEFVTRHVIGSSNIGRHLNDLNEIYNILKWEVKPLNNNNFLIIVEVTGKNKYDYLKEELEEYHESK